MMKPKKRLIAAQKNEIQWCTLLRCTTNSINTTKAHIYSIPVTSLHLWKKQNIFFVTKTIMCVIMILWNNWKTTLDPHQKVSCPKVGSTFFFTFFSFFREKSYFIDILTFFNKKNKKKKQNTNRQTFTKKNRNQKNKKIAIQKKKK